MYLRPWPNDSIFLSILYSTENRGKIEPFGHLVERVEWSRVILSEFDLCQKSRAKELLLSENRAVWPPCRASRVKACAVVSHWEGKYLWCYIFQVDTRSGNE